MLIGHDDYVYISHGVILSAVLVRLWSLSHMLKGDNDYSYFICDNIKCSIFIVLCSVIHKRRIGHTDYIYFVRKP